MGLVWKELSSNTGISTFQVFLGKARTDDQAAVALELDHMAPERVVNISSRGYAHDVGSDVTSEYQGGRLSDTIRDNMFAPLILAVETQKRDIHLSFLGNNCLSSCSANGQPISEKNPTDFFGSSLSVVNGFTDRLVGMYDENTLNCRINMPVSFDSSSRNLVTKLTQPIRIHNVYNSVTVLDDILPHMVDLAQKSKTGTYNLTNPGVISHNEILEMYREVVDPSFNWDNIEDMHMRDKADTGLVLETGKLQKDCPSVLPVREALRQSMVRMAMLKFNTKLQNE